jgi:hypothetical protein
VSTDTVDSNKGYVIPHMSVTWQAVKSKRSYRWEIIFKLKIILQFFKSEIHTRFGVGLITLLSSFICLVHNSIVVVSAALLYYHCCIIIIMSIIIPKVLFDSTDRYIRKSRDVTKHKLPASEAMLKKISPNYSNWILIKLCLLSQFLVENMARQGIDSLICEVYLSQKYFQ